jgi:hypothetical protein
MRLSNEDPVLLTLQTVYRAQQNIADKDEVEMVSDFVERCANADDTILHDLGFDRYSRSLVVHSSRTLQQLLQLI